MNLLIQPKKYKSLMADEGSKVIMNKTIAFFEKMGKTRLLDDYNKKVWYREFVDFIGKEQIFAKLLTPKQYAGGDPDARWDTESNDDIKLLLMEEQTLLSRERTMHSYMQTGLAFTSVGLVIMKFLSGLLYFCAGVLFIIIGFLLIAESARRYVHFRKAIQKLREKETKLGSEIGMVR